MDHPRAEDPFADPTTTDPSPASGTRDHSDVLTVDRNATLTLGTDSLIVLDEGLAQRRAASNLCGLLPQSSPSTRAIPFYNVLFAELKDFDVTVHYAQAVGKKAKDVRVGYINYAVTDKSLHPHAKKWVDALMGRAYPANTKRRKKIKVLINPFGGQGYAQKLWTRQIEPVFAAAQCDIEVEKTAYRGHAVEIAQKMDVDAFDVVACASGDGLPHEVFNGLAKQENPRRALRKVAVVQLPCGSGNAMCMNLNGTDSPSLAALAIIKGVRAPMDLVAITQGSDKYYSFLSQSVGIVAESDLGTDHLRWMGPLRFTWGFLVRLLGKTVYPAEISVAVEQDDKRAIRENYKRKIEKLEATRAKRPDVASDSECDDEIVTTEVELPPLRYGTVTDAIPSDFVTTDLPTLGNFYCGNMCFMSGDAPFFPCSLPSDGRMDLVNIDGTIPRLKAISMLTSVEQGALMNFPEVNYRKVTGYRIVPRLRDAAKRDGVDSKGLGAKMGKWLGGGKSGGKEEGYISIDGERVPFEPFQAEICQGLGTVLSKRGGVYEFDGPASP
ncbi:hypothetical protein MBLNU230_g6593t1 [Neophaeotheca triangularis]